MAFSSPSSFTINPDVLYMDKGERLVLTFATLEDKLYEIDQLAKGVFLMAINDFTYEQILEAVAKTNIKENLQPQVDKLLTDLIQMNILTVNA